eukprot:scaffold34615_cov180-Amphora_coffeaeformis.AAC.7
MSGSSSTRVKDTGSTQTLEWAMCDVECQLRPHIKGCAASMRNPKYMRIPVAGGNKPREKQDRLFDVIFHRSIWYTPIPFD